MKRNLFPTSTSPQVEAQPDRKEALRIAVEKYGGFVLDYLRCKTGDEEAARDLSQELWQHVSKSFDISNFENPVRLRYKAYQLFSNRQRYNKTRRFVEFTRDVPDMDGTNAFAEPQTSADEEKFTREFWEQFPNATLTDEQKKAFFLKHRSGHTYEEIAKLMNISVSTAHLWVATVIEECRRHSRKELL